MKDPPAYFETIDRICAWVFIIDYFLRLATADYRFGKRGISSFLRYPFSFTAIVDFLCIMPSIPWFIRTFQSIRVFRLLRAFRIFKIFRYSPTMRRVTAVFRESRRALVAVFSLAVGYILLSALAIFSVLRKLL